jgi:hypothetical protein
LVFPLSVEQNGLFSAVFSLAPAFHCQHPAGVTLWQYRARAAHPFWKRLELLKDPVFCGSVESKSPLSPPLPLSMI